jgi:hypothetical protein
MPQQSNSPQMYTICPSIGHNNCFYPFRHCYDTRSNKIYRLHRFNAGIGHLGKNRGFGSKYHKEPHPRGLPGPKRLPFRRRTASIRPFWGAFRLQPLKLRSGTSVQSWDNRQTGTGHWVNDRASAGRPFGRSMFGIPPLGGQELKSMLTTSRPASFEYLSFPLVTVRKDLFPLAF